MRRDRYGFMRQRCDLDNPHQTGVRTGHLGETLTRGRVRLQSVGGHGDSWGMTSYRSPSRRSGAGGIDAVESEHRGEAAVKNAEGADRGSEGGDAGEHGRRAANSRLTTACPWSVRAAIRIAGAPARSIVAARDARRRFRRSLRCRSRCRDGALSGARWRRGASGPSGASRIIKARGRCLFVKASLLKSRPGSARRSAFEAHCRAAGVSFLGLALGAQRVRTGLARVLSVGRLLGRGVRGRRC